jgi:hypothetical protein
LFAFQKVRHWALTDAVRMLEHKSYMRVVAAMEGMSVQASATVESPTCVEQKLAFSVLVWAAPLASH